MTRVYPSPVRVPAPTPAKSESRGGALRAALAVATLFAGMPAGAAAEQWIEVKSPNVTVVSSAGGGPTRTLAWQLEQVRVAVKTLWPWATVDLDRPFTVLAVDDETGMRALAPRFWEGRGGVRPASVWVAAPDQYFLAIRTDQQAEGTHNINPHASAYFMYVSLILDQSVDAELPDWLSRGLAGVLSNTIVHDSNVVVGAPIPWHLDMLRERGRLTLPALLKVKAPSRELTTGDGLERFDAQAWAFVHFLMYGKQGARSGPLNQFFRLVATGTDRDAAFAQVFGKPEALEDEFALYTKGTIFTFQQVNVDVSVKRERFAQRNLPAAESASVRALLHAAMDRPVEARAAVAEARKGGPAPESSLAEAMLLDREQKRDDAALAFGRAVSEGSKSAYAHYRLATLRWVPGASKETLQEMDKLLSNAIEFNVRHARAYSLLGEIRSLLGSPGALGLAIRATQLQPSEVNHRLVVARILTREKRQEDALKVLDAAASLASTPEQTAQLGELRKAAERPK